MSDDDPRRHGDPPHFNPRTLRRDPVKITLNRGELAAAIATSRKRSALYAAIAAVMTAIVVSALVGLWVKSAVTTTVSRDVGRAAQRNCARTNRIAPAVQSLKAFLDSDAHYARQLRALDDQQRRLNQQLARVDHDLAVQIHSLGPILPAGISHDYQQLAELDARNATVSQQLGRLRARAARLWDGPPVKRHGQPRLSSLAAQVQLLGQTPCDQILTP